MGKIIFISGGISSGKSDFAERLCDENGGKTLYIATSVPFDEEMKEKKRKHIEKRLSKKWDTLEKYSELYKEIEEIGEKYNTVLLDCVTMMVSNLIFRDNHNFNLDSLLDSEEKSREIVAEVKRLIEEIKKTDTKFIVVTNEIGLGGISENRLSRFFSQLCGEINQIFAKSSEEAYLLVSGIAVKIK